MTRATSSISSSASRAFGADVRVGDPPISLFLVVGRNGPPDAALAAVGAQVAVRLDRRRVLAIAPFGAVAPLLRNPIIETAGPVHVDPRRLASFAALKGVVSV